VNPFYHRIYRVVRHIPKGRVATYGLVARLAGRPGAARTVGWALSALPEDADVPWWRVLNAAGRISLSGADHGAVRLVEVGLRRRDRAGVGRVGVQLRHRGDELMNQAERGFDVERQQVLLRDGKHA